jgi:integrin alpha FG-GAP repeat containing protein 1
MLFVAAGDPHGGFLGIGAEADTVPILIVSKECKKGLVGCGEDGKGKRGWEAVRFGGTEAKDDKGIGAGWEALQVVRDARSVSFVDMDEDVSCVFSHHEMTC